MSLPHDASSSQATPVAEVTIAARVVTAGVLLGAATGGLEAASIYSRHHHLLQDFPAISLAAALSRAVVLHVALWIVGFTVSWGIVSTVHAWIQRPRKTLSDGTRPLPTLVWAGPVISCVLAVGLLWRGRYSVLGALHIFDSAVAVARSLLVPLVSALLLGAALGWLLQVAMGLLGPLLSRRSSKTWAALGLMLSLLGVVAASRLFDPDDSRRSDAAQLDDSRPNVLLIVVDTLRGDRLGCYGYDRPTSPFLDSLCERSLVYEQAVVQYPATGPSFGSIFTGKYVRGHGLSAMDPRAWIGGDFNRTWAEILAEAGYETGAVMTGSLTRSSGLARGFQRIYEAQPAHGVHHVASAWQTVRSRMLLFRTWVRVEGLSDPAPVVAEAERWLAAAERPFFYFVHLFDPHSPYDPPADLLARLVDGTYDGPLQSIYSPFLRAVRAGQRALELEEVDRLEDLYDAEVLAADRGIERLIRALDATGTRDNTVVIVTSDHGEELYEHGLVEHGYVYNTNLLVPLIIDFPGSEPGQRISGPVELIDLMPTVLDYLGVRVPRKIDGELLPVDARLEASKHEPAASSEAAAFSEADCSSLGGRTTQDCWLSIQTAEWKLDLNRTRDEVRLFHIRTDPLEARNVVEQEPEIRDQLEARLRAWDAQQLDLDALRNEISESGRQEIEERLRSLGYL